MTIVEQTDLSQVTYPEVNEPGEETLTENVSPELHQDDLDREDSGVSNGDISECVENDTGSAETCCDTDASHTAQGPCTVDHADRQDVVNEKDKINEPECETDKKTRVEGDDTTISNSSQNAPDSAVPKEVSTCQPENTDSAPENVTIAQDPIPDAESSDMVQDMQNDGPSQEKSAEPARVESKEEPDEIAATPKNKPPETDSAKPEVKMTETFKPKVEHPKIYPVIAEETPDPGSIKPFTAEQLKSLYYNAELEHLDDFVDNFLQVRAYRNLTFRGALCECKTESGNWK